MTRRNNNLHKYLNCCLIVIPLIVLLNLQTVTSLTCADNQYPCADGFHCVVETYLCDGDKDCADGSDESRCCMFPKIHDNS